MEQQKKAYVAPSVEESEFPVEEGFAVSNIRVMDPNLFISPSSSAEANVDPFVEPTGTYYF